MVMNLRIANEDDAKTWDSFIERSYNGSLFHSWTWLRLAEKHTGTILYPLMALKENSPVAVFPLFLQKKGPFRLVFSPPPSTVLFYLGPVFSDFDIIKQERREKVYIEFQESVDLFIKNTLCAQYISISLSPELSDPRPFLWSGYDIEPQYDYVINLKNESDFLLDSLAKKPRQNMRRAKKRGMTVELGGRKEYEEILNLMDIRYAQQGKNVNPSRKYLLDIFDAYKKYMRIFIARLNDDIVTGSIDFQYKDTHYSWIGNPKPRYPVTPSPNDLLIWESVLFARESGMKYYVTMNAAGNKRLHTYYASKFNPALKVHFSLKKSTVLMNIMEKGYSGIVKPFR